MDMKTSNLIFFFDNCTRGHLFKIVKPRCEKTLRLNSFPVRCINNWNTLSEDIGAPRVLWIWGEWLFIFRELGSTGNYFRGARDQAHNFGDIGSLAKKQKNKEKPPFCLIF